MNIELFKLKYIFDNQYDIKLIHYWIYRTVVYSYFLILFVAILVTFLQYYKYYRFYMFYGITWKIAGDNFIRDGLLLYCGVAV